MPRDGEPPGYLGHPRTTPRPDLICVAPVPERTLSVYPDPDPVAEQTRRFDAFVEVLAAGAMFLVLGLLAGVAVALVSFGGYRDPPGLAVVAGFGVLGIASGVGCGPRLVGWLHRRLDRPGCQ